MRIAAALACLLTMTAGLLACQVPVFRYALERWAADDFELLVTSRGPLDPELQNELDTLQESLDDGSASINLRLKIVDLATLTEIERISLPALDNLGEEPTMVLLPPASWLVSDPVWSGPATTANLALLLDSPARRQCAAHLTSGESAVWMLVKSGDPEKDSRAEAVLSAALARATSELEIPVGVVRREDLNRPIENLDLDNVLRSDLPLKISFVSQTVSRDDPAEAIFLPTLIEEEALQSGEPLILPIFGRGRTYGAFPALRITESDIFSACEYLCGACSCQAKSGNPGYDLLFSTDWDAHLNNTVITADSPVVQNNLEVVSYNPPERATTKTAVPDPGKLPLLPAALALVAVSGAGLVFMTFLGKDSAPDS